ncbi:MAG TPA: amidohydrolase family protein [Actinomycetota bacterium]
MRRAASDAVGLKTIVAYRGGFDFDPARPGQEEVAIAADGFANQAGESGSRPRLTDPVLLRFGIWTGIDLSADEGLPLQIHAGYGDPDLRLHLADPSRLGGLVKAAAGSGAEFVFLHCYPFHREAAYMADVYPNVSFDVGWLTHYAGPSSTRIVAEALEVASFASQLYSSDAFGLPEQYLVAAAQFRRALGSVLDRWIADGDCTAGDADRIVALLARENARRIYRRLS